MKRLVLAAALASAAFALPATPANAGCDGKVTVLCDRANCSPDYPCTPVFCVLYVAPRCVV